MWREEERRDNMWRVEEERRYESTGRHSGDESHARDSTEGSHVTAQRHRGNPQGGGLESNARSMQQRKVACVRTQAVHR